MTTVQKRSGTSETLRSGAGVTLPDSGGQALANATEAWFAASAECQREMIGFVSMRLEKDGEIAREIMASKNLADVAAIQSRWMEETLRDYNDEMGKLMTICTKSVNGGAGAKG
ncbi:phasin family protein [Microvirga mediterraneensis]|uniref:Phasin family protein n=1 Tax=Microvirga mediterraneensis TaxID=2754695 RepID=A0A838BP66_9HYPH|nr:phasin family protein [Microvirga mediterraneensis]MBA1156825.1 phasin family protein [Microvirga mediterraneensis]